MTKCFQISKLFGNLTVYENVQIARIEMNKKTFSVLPVRDAYLKEEGHDLSEPGSAWKRA